MVDSFIDALAKPKPVPGGGAAAAYGASVGLALLEKIVTHDDVILVKGSRAMKMEDIVSKLVRS